MLRHLFHILLNPFFQALVVACLIILFVPLGLKKYIAEQADMTTVFDKNQVIFKDLDHDGFSERIQTFYNKSGNVAVSIHQDYTTFGQWNFKGVYGHKSIRFMAGDYDKDSLDELYIFTLENDSIYLHILEYSFNPEFIRRDRFIDQVGKTLKDFDYIILEGEVNDMTGDGRAELVFGISAGFSLQPRNVYHYDIFHDSLYKSPKSGAYIENLHISDLNGDGFNEIILSTIAPGNFNEEPFPFSDTNSYLMVLDHNLDFLFTPIKFPNQTSTLDALRLKSNSGRSLILCRYSHASIKNDPGKFLIIDANGKILKEKNISVDDKLFNIKLLKPVKMASKDVITGAVPNDGIYYIDEDLNFNRFEAEYSSRKPTYIDIDNDGCDEIITLAANHQQYLIYRYNFTSPIAINFPIQSTIPLFSVKLNGSNPPQLSVQGDQVWKLFDYGINPLWRYRFLIWLGIYLATLGFILLIRKLYSFQLKKKYETEQKITRLQLAGIKAQMEPHFIMNTINTIGSSIYRKKPEEAYSLLLNFSGMVRSLLISSDKLTRTLGEEIEFVTNYLELERSRFADLFTYEIYIADEVKTDTVIAKMIIQLHTENALKHGLLPKKTGGTLKINVNRTPENTVITITDNGIGRNMASKNISQSTGKGMKILAQLFETYNKHNKNQLRQEIVDLFDDANKPSGTEVRVFIPNDFNAGIF